MLEIYSSKTIYLAGTLIPLIVSNILHMIVVKKNWLSILNFPINEGWFGKNKTYRGFIVLPLVNGILYTILNWSESYSVSKLNTVINHNFSINNPTLFLFIIGGIYGLFYVIFELPNSFIKRRLGIEAGEYSQKYRFFFKLIDKTDSAFGLTLFYGYLNHFNIHLMIEFLLIAVVLHVVLSLILVAAKIKKSF